MEFDKNLKLAKYNFVGLQIGLLHLQLFYLCNLMEHLLNKDHLNYQDNFYIYHVYLIHKNLYHVDYLFKDSLRFYHLYSIFFHTCSNINLYASLNAFFINSLTHVVLYVK